MPDMLSPNSSTILHRYLNIAPSPVLVVLYLQEYLHVLHLWGRQGSAGPASLSLFIV
jgi:hypothetical protein